MSYLSSDAQSKYVFSRTGVPGSLSHTYSSTTQSFLTSNNQSKYLNKESLATVSDKKPDSKFLISKSSNPSESHSISNASNLSNQTNINLRTNSNSLSNNRNSLNNNINVENNGQNNGSNHNIASSNNNSTSTLNLNSKQDFLSKERSYQTTIDSLQRKIEQLSNENKKLSDNISTKSTSVMNRSIDEKEQKDKLMTILEEKEKIEKNYKQKIERLTDENSKLIKEVTSKQTEIKNLEKKLTEIVSVETDTKEQEMISSKTEIQKLRSENKDLGEKLSEKQKKYEELEEIYKQKLSQFKKEIMLIKTQQQNQSPKDLQPQENSNGIKELHELLKKEKENSSELEKKLENINKMYEEKKHENLELKNRFMSLEKEKFNSNQKNLQFSFSNNFGNNDSKIFSASPIQNSRVGSFVKCNLDDFEEKINNLLQENENLNNTVKESHYWKEKFQELEDKGSKNDEKEGSHPQIMSSKMKTENDELKRNLTDITNDNSKIKSKLLELEKKFSNLERDYTERMSQKEEDLTKNYEKIIKELEEQKEKNINKISKENHELKQQNDDFQKQIQKLLLKSKAFDSQDRPPDKLENKQLPPNSSPILIINEMMTPSASMYKIEKAKDPKTNTVLQQKTFGGLAPINENQEENNSSGSGDSKLIKKQPETLKKMTSLGASNNPNQNPSSSSNNINMTNGNNMGQNNEKTSNLMIQKQSSLIYSQQGLAKLPQTQTSINSQMNSQLKIAEINQSKLLQAKSNDIKSHMRNPFIKENPKEPTNNSNSNNSFAKEKSANESKTEFYKGESHLNSQSRTDLKASNIMNSFNPFKQSAEMAAKKDIGKDKKVIMFNLMDNHKKLNNNGSASEGPTSGYMGGNYSSNK